MFSNEQIAIIKNFAQVFVNLLDNFLSDVKMVFIISKSEIMFQNTLNYIKTICNVKFIIESILDHLAFNHIASATIRSYSR